MNKITFLFLFTLPFVYFESVAAEMLDCPATIALDSATIKEKNLGVGFSVLVSDKSLLLSGANVFDGPPEDGAVLKAKNQVKQGAVETLFWQFDGVYPQGKWISCDYAEGFVRLAIKIDDASTRCKVLVGKRNKPEKLTLQFKCE